MRPYLFAIALLAPLASVAVPQPKPRDGEAQIRFRAGPSDLVIGVSRRVAGAIDSVTWGGREFIDRLDHGRELQSACAFGSDRRGEFWAECYNPTEAGSRRDGSGQRSTSQLLFLKQTPTELMTVTRMAFWLAPGEKSSGHPALNRDVISDFLLTKDVAMNAEGQAHAIRHRVTFTVPPGDRHTYGQFEALTGYMSPTFSVFETFDPKTGHLAPIADGPGEQHLPLVFSTPDGGYAMGVYSREPGVSYGRWRFTPEKVVKWNAVFRERGDPLPSGPRTFTLFSAVGSRHNVRDTLAALTSR